MFDFLTCFFVFGGIELIQCIIASHVMDFKDWKFLIKVTGCSPFGVDGLIGLFILQILECLLSISELSY